MNYFLKYLPILSSQKKVQHILEMFIWLDGEHCMQLYYNLQFPELKDVRKS